jgi:hypothetical protein
MSLSKEMGWDIPENQVYLPPESKRRIFDRDFSIREITCDTCKEVLCALVIAEEHEADFVWPFDVICETMSRKINPPHQFPNHRLIAKGTKDAAKVFCKGRAAQEWEAKKYLEKYL